jgi:hypothetical protein
MAQANSGEFLTPEAQLAFSDGLFEKRSVDGVKFNFGCTLIFPEKDRAFFMEKIRDVVGKKWGEKGQRDFDRGVIKNPLLAGDGPSAISKQSGELWAGFGPGKFFIRANANEDAQPHVYWLSKHVQATKEDVYSGCYGIAVLNAYSWENPSGGRGVSFGIRAFRKTRDGESLGGRAPFNPDKWFVDLDDKPEGSVDIFS